MIQPAAPFLPVSHASRDYPAEAFRVIPDLLAVDFQMTHNSA